MNELLLLFIVFTYRFYCYKQMKQKDRVPKYLRLLRGALG